MSLSDLLVSFQHRRKLQKLAQLQRDFAFIVNRTRKERSSATVVEIAEDLQRRLTDTQARLEAKPADSKVILYDLTQSNRAARHRNDQVGFTAMTLAIIYYRAQQLSGHPGLIQSDSKVSVDSVSYQLDRFLEDPCNENSNLQA